MPTTLETVRPIELADMREARKRIAKTIVHTPLIRLELGPDYLDIRLKLENLQPINAYELRGAANAVALLSESTDQNYEEREYGARDPGPAVYLERATTRITCPAFALRRTSRTPAGSLGRDRGADGAARDQLAGDRNGYGRRVPGSRRWPRRLELFEAMCLALHSYEKTVCGI